MRPDYFVTGTDTGVGKSRAAAALLHALARQGLRAVGMKPVAAGASQTPTACRRTRTCSRLRAASNVRVPAGLDNPVCLADPVSPHIAARNAGTRIDIALIADRFSELRALADAVVVEGAGGFLVPLGDRETGADLAQALQLPVILVVGLRLGCLNHALLTRDAIRARGLPLAGWICNRLDPAMPEQQANLDYLRARLGAPLLADWRLRSAGAPRRPADAAAAFLTRCPIRSTDFENALGELDANKLLRRRRVVTPIDGARVIVDGVERLAFCSNDYLGLAQHPALVEAAREAALRHGVGAGASPLVSGHGPAHEALEAGAGRLRRPAARALLLCGLCRQQRLHPGAGRQG